MGYSDLQPVHYTLRFEPDLEKFSFQGAALIEARVLKKTKTVELDCSELDIKNCRIFLSPASHADAHDRITNAKPGLVCSSTGGLYGTGSGSRDAGKDSVAIPQSMISLNDAAERLIIKLPKNLPIDGNIAILVEFSGTLNDRLLGFYRSRYSNRGRTKHLATTQFEAADARRAFPCHDKPDSKATFDVSIAVFDKRHTAISNMPVAKIVRNGGRRTFHFAKTPKMSTYLLYLGVGEFVHSGASYRSTSGDVVQIRIVTTKSVKKDTTKFALRCAKQLLHLYESYFAIPYPLPKLDLIAIPDFAAGAMENWGAITFRENLLLYDSKTSSVRTKQLIAEVISHELAHQWFGNLVTMKWWNDLWLNESFATFMAIKLLDSVYPEWDLWTQFLTDAMKTAMDLDSMHSTHPIDVPVKSPSQIREIFDPISYDKGGCILRMLEHYVGEQSFVSGLQEYLAQFSYKNARGEDLWRCIERTSGKPVLRMMTSWLGKPGFPAVHVATKKNGTYLDARQVRYVQRAAGGKSHARASRDDLWPIPLSIKKHDEDDHVVHLLSRRSAMININPDSGRKSMVVVNPGRTGFYRVIYDANLLLDMQLLAEAKRLDSSELWALQDDLFAMCMSGLASTRDYLEMIGAYRHVQDPAVLLGITHNMSRLHRLSFDIPAAAGEIGRYAAEFSGLVHRDVTGWNARRNESHTASLLRGPVIMLLGRLGMPDISDKCGQFYDGLASTGPPGTLQPDLVEPVLATRAWSCKSESDARSVHHMLAGLYKKADNTEKKMRYLGAMCGFNSPDALLRTLNFALSCDVRSQNTFLPIVRVSENPHGTSVLWPWVQRRWPAIIKKVGHGNPLLGRVISSLANSCLTSDIPNMRKFFSENPVPGTERTLLQTFERIRINSEIGARIKREFGKSAL